MEETFNARKSVHTPVMVDEVLNIVLSAGCFSVGEKRTFFDGTLGSGGYTESLLKATSPDGLVIGVDKDPQAVKRCRHRLENYIASGRLQIIREDFRYVDKILEDLGVEQIHGAILDLGMSSDQVEDAMRGFSFLNDGPLDMRMDIHALLSATHVVNRLSERELARIFLEYGEEKHARRIARAIVEYRKHTPITRTLQLVEIIMKVLPSKEIRSRIHPATRVFQALRVYVNDELNALKDFLKKIPTLLIPGGVVCIVSFHSLEDRIVKQTFRSWAHPCECPRNLPMCMCGKKPLAKIITRKAVMPSFEEVQENPRSRSARLRAAQRIE